MIGTFTTTKFANRRDYTERRPSGVVVSHNRFTLIGMEWMWAAMTGQHRDGDGTLTDSLNAARLVVGDSEQPHSYNDTTLVGPNTAESQATHMAFERVSLGDEDGPNAVELVLRATFGEQEAAFDWRERGVLSASGVLIDRAVSDQGRKVLGAIWELEARLSLEG